MTGRGDSSKARRRAKRKYRYFFADGKPYRAISISYPRDEVLAWSFTENERRLFQWSDVRARASRGFTSGEVGKLLNRHPEAFKRWVREGRVKKPIMISYPNSTRKFWLFSEEDVQEFFEVAKTIHRGRPRNDGFINPQSLPNDKDLYGKLKNDVVLYTQTPEGKFIPVYEAEDW